MRTNIVIDGRLIEEAMNYTGLRTKKKVVDFALRELIKRKKRKKILDFKGRLRWEGDLDEMRSSRSDDTR